MFDFRVKILVFSDGERYPILLKADGNPAFMPTLYVTTMVRSANHAAKTLELHLRAIAHFYAWASIENLDIESRFARGEKLNLHELDAIVRACRAKYDGISRTRNEPSGQMRARKVVSLEKLRSSSPGKKLEVTGETAAARVRVIRDYLDWLMLKSYGRLSIKSEYFKNFEIARREMFDSMTARLPKSRGRSHEGQRESLVQKDIEYLLKILKPGDVENPWKDRSLALRNQIVFLMAYTLGLRRGELLGIKITDLNFQTREVLIRRRADDPEDVRADQPNAKTRDRRLPLVSILSDLLHDYIVKHRSQISHAKYHSFLFVTHKPGPYVGRPLSIVGYSKMVETLRERAPALPDNLSGHVMRHSWNYNFSRMMDKQGLSEEREQQFRSYLMGWSPTSKTAATYTRRHIREKGTEASLAIQKNIIGKAGDDE